MAFELRSHVTRAGYGAAVEKWARQLARLGTSRDRSRLQQLVEMAYDYEAEATLRISEFLDVIATRRVADPTSSRVRVMTIHQAKGLQFDVVVLPELDEQWHSQMGYVTDQPDVSQPIKRLCVYRNREIQKLLPPEYQAMFQRAKERHMAEFLCVLYVAMTRAVRALHLLVPPKSTQRQTAAALVLAALGHDRPLEPESLVFEQGTEDWDDAATTSESTPPPLEETETQPLERIQFAATSQRRVGRRAVSPSSLEGGSHVDLGAVFRPRQATAMARGSLIHAWFEQLQWLDDAPPDEGALRQASANLVTAGLDLEQTLADFYHMLQQPDTAQVLSRSFYDRFEQFNRRIPDVPANSTVGSAQRTDVRRPRW